MIEANVLLKKIDDLEAEYIQFWRDLCEIESPTLHKEGVDAVAKMLIDKGQEYGMSIDCCPFEKAGNSYTITLNPDAKKKPICFSAHMDTIHQLGSFSSPRTRIEGDTIYGPGVTDDKGGLAAAMYAMVALAECGFKDRPIKFILQPDEENASAASNLGSVEYMRKQAEGCLCFYNLEWYRYGKAILWRKGSFSINVKVHGLSYHGSRSFLGHSAIAQAAYMVTKFEELKSPEGVSSNVGLFNGGHYRGSVPDYAEFCCSFNYMTDEDRKMAKKLVKEVCENPVIEGTTVEYEIIEGFPNMIKMDSAFEVLDKMNVIYKNLGMREIEATWSHGGSDAARMNQFGITTIDSFGTNGAFIHTPEENGVVSSLKDAAQRLAVVAAYIED